MCIQDQQTTSSSKMTDGFLIFHIKQDLRSQHLISYLNYINYSTFRTYSLSLLQFFNFIESFIYKINVNQILFLLYILTFATLTLKNLQTKVEEMNFY